VLTLGKWERCARVLCTSAGHGAAEALQGIFPAALSTRRSPQATLATPDLRLRNGRGPAVTWLQSPGAL
jgi:hypothetical protein